ncbi:putative ABC transporter permease [Brucepastera parasyntrophica]|uniref:putative ABC transporter permease n=1 Tax=Brucepastera parasyntrophica TaxID=2880008 RepID=UPI0021092CEF|nr:putative ABC transporter permease [Brucepastera parasyntrophica]ULQ60946.1 putative ABC transporter permease [Brucepastera parasyntrophica]
MTLSYLFILFILYSVIGWLCEVVYVLITQRKFVNRGILRGPVCPIFGFGALIIVFCLEPFKSNIIFLFVMAVIVSAVLEYITSWILEMIFAAKWWDYTNSKFSLNGRISLLNSVIIGVLGTLCILFVQPAFEYVLNLFPEESLNVIAFILALILFVDIVLTLRTLVHFSARLTDFKILIRAAKKAPDKFEWFDREDLPGSIARLRHLQKTDTTGIYKQFEQLLDTFVKPPSGVPRLLMAFPGLKLSREVPDYELLKDAHLTDLRQVLQAPSAPADTETERTVPAQKKEKKQTAERTIIKPKIYEYVWIFAAAGYIGLIVETLWMYITTGEFYSRIGFMHIWVKPIYGAGGVLMTMLLLPQQKRRDLFIFVYGVVIGGAFEYLCSVIQQLMFNSVSWEYHDTPLNLHGRTNLFFSFCWGFLALLWIRFAFPGFMHLIRKIPPKISKILAIIFAVLLVSDAAYTAAVVRRWSERRDGIAAKTAVGRFFDEYYPNEKMERLYSNMKFLDKSDPEHQGPEPAKSDADSGAPAGQPEPLN